MSAAAMDARQLRDAFGAFITGVTVVTAQPPEGAPVGFTANSFTSVSLNPPLLLVCPSRHLTTFPIFNTCAHFAVNILAEDQREIANRFAYHHDDRFGATAWRACAQTGAPLLDGAAATFSCRAHRRTDGGDHIVLMGEVAAFSASGAPALGYANGGYFGLALERRADALAHQARKFTVGVIIEHAGKVLLYSAPGGGGRLALPQVQVAQHTGSLVALQEFLAAAGIAAQIGAVYAVVEDARSGAHSVYYRGTVDADAAADCGGGAYYPVAEAAARAETHIAIMMRRYEMEHRSGDFGFYIGDATAGEVHRPPAQKREGTGG